MKLDLRNFNQALLAKRDVTKRKAAQILNQSMKQLADNISTGILPVPPARIRRDLESDPHLLAALTSKRLAKKGIGILKPPRFRQAMNRFLRFKMASSGYMRAPWGQLVDRRRQRFLGIYVLKISATPSRLKCEASFTMAHETTQKRRTAKQRFVRQMQPALDAIVAGISASDVLKGWKG